MAKNRGLYLGHSFLVQRQDKAIGTVDPRDIQQCADGLVFSHLEQNVPQNSSKEGSSFFVPKSPYVDRQSVREHARMRVLRQHQKVTGSLECERSNQDSPASSSIVHAETYEAHIHRYKQGFRSAISEKLSREIDAPAPLAYGRPL